MTFVNSLNTLCIGGSLGLVRKVGRLNSHDEVRKEAPFSGSSFRADDIEVQVQRQIKFNFKFIKQFDLLEV